MKFLKKQGVAWIITIVMIVAAIAIGAARAPAQQPHSGNQTAALDTSLPSADYHRWILDGASVLSSSTEEAICLYNANWDYRYNSLIAVVTVDYAEGDIEDYAYQLGADAGLGEGDALVLLAVDDGDFYVAVGTEFGTIITSDVEHQLSAILTDALTSGDYNGRMESFLQTMNQTYYNRFGLGNGESYSDGDDGFSTLVGLIFVVVIVLIILNSIDQ